MIKFKRLYLFNYGDDGVVLAKNKKQAIRLYRKYYRKTEKACDPFTVEFADRKYRGKSHFIGCLGDDYMEVCK